MCFYGTPPDASTDTGWEPEPVCPGADTDGDLILDEHEGAGDDDGDTIPNDEDTDSDDDTILDLHEAGDVDCATEPVDTDGDTLADFVDTDSDGDTVADSQEAGDADPETRPRDTDGWGFPDYRDTDSDGDGLGDGQEEEIGTDRVLADTDGDGHEDMVELASSRGDPLDPSLWPGASERVFVLWYRGRSMYETLVLGLDYKAMDVMFLVDDTHDAAAAVHSAALSLSTSVLPAMADEVEGLRTGAAAFSGWVMPEALMDPTCRMPQVGLRRLSGVDHATTGDLLVSLPHCPEPLLGASFVDALHETVVAGTAGTWPPGEACADGFGGACFSPAARRVLVVMLAGTFPSSTPPGYGPYHTLSETTLLVQELGVHVAGLVAGGTEDPAWGPLESLADSTATRDLTGRELIYDIGPAGEIAEPALLSLLSDITRTMPNDVTLAVEDGPDWPEGDEEVDAASMVSIRPEGWSPPPGYSPSQACTEMEGDAFLGCLPGTVVAYDVYYRNYQVEQEVRGRIFRGDLVLSGSDGYEFFRAEIGLVVPALDGDSLSE
jgi:hypothetical protein